MPSRLLNRLLFVNIGIAFVLFTSLSLAQPAPHARFRVQQWTTEDGLPEDRIGCIQQTRDGYIWIGTWNGLARFDGVRFTVFNRQNTPELSDDAISSLVEDEQGNLWMGTRAGLVRHNANGFKHFSTAEAMSDGSVWQLGLAKGGGLWIQTGDRVARFQDGHFSQAWRPPVGDRILSLQEGADGWLNIFGTTGWCALSPEANVMRTNRLLAPGEPKWYAAYLGEQAGEIWVGTDSGFYVLKQSVLTEVAKSPAVMARVDKISKDRAGRFWINVKGHGLFRQEGEGWSLVELGGDWTRNSTVCIFEDYERGIWLGHDFGLVRLQPQFARTYSAADGLTSDKIWSVCETEEGDVRIGADVGDCCINKDGTASALSRVPGSDFRGRSVWPKPGGGIWIGKDHLGLAQIVNGEFRVVSRHDGLAIITAIYQDGPDRLWIGTNTRLWVYEQEQLKEDAGFPGSESLLDVHAITKSPQGSLWFGAKGVLGRLDHGVLTRFDFPVEYGTPKISCIHVSGDETLWLATEAGLVRFKNGKMFRYTVQHGLRGGRMYCVLEDQFEFLWVSGQNGIERVARNSLEAVTSGKASDVGAFSLSVADGMATVEANGGDSPSGWRSRDGRLWFATARGLMMLDPKDVPSSELGPTIVIEQVKANQKVVAEQMTSTGEGEQRISQAKLPPGTGRMLEFSFTANTFASPAAARFKYRLVGFKADWSPDTKQRAVGYHNLQPGNYRFEVKGANQHNTWSTGSAVYAFSIAPYFWQTWPFYGLCGATILFLGSGIQAYRLRWQRRLLKLEEQRALASERARIARDLHDDLGTALTGLALELEVAGRESASPNAEAKMKRSADHARQLADRMREVVWSVNPRCDTVSSLADFLEDQVRQFLQSDGLRVSLDFPENIPDLPLGTEARHHLALSVREALTNVVKHSRATEVTVQLALDGHAPAKDAVNGEKSATSPAKNGVLELVVLIKDNGRGFRFESSTGHGLMNMRQRIEQVGGRFNCTSGDKGTSITFCLPLSRL